MRLTFLGTSAGAPTRERGLSAVALRLDDGRVWLVDCGEGTQRRALQERIPLARVDRVLLTHLHGDHCFGLPGLLATQGLQGRRQAVEVVGPTGVARWIGACLETSRTHLPFPLEIRELAEPGPLGSRGTLALEAWPLVHRVPSFAYVIREAPRRGHLDRERARALGVPGGPLLGRLAAGETVTLADGRRIEPQAVLGPERPGRVLALCGDSADSRAIEGPAAGCDLLVHECTYGAERREAAHRYGHSTSDDVAALVSRLRPRQVVLTHFSSRYTVTGADPDVEDLRRTVETRCPHTRVVAARDGTRVEVAPREG